MVDIVFLVIGLSLWTVSMAGSFFLGWWVHTQLTGEVKTQRAEETEEEGKSNIRPRWNPGNLLNPYTSEYQEKEWDYAEKVNKEESI